MMHYLPVNDKMGFYDYLNKIVFQTCDLTIMTIKRNKKFAKT